MIVNVRDTGNKYKVTFIRGLGKDKEGNDIKTVVLRLRLDGK